MPKEQIILKIGGEVMKLIFPERWLYQNLGDKKVKLTWVFKKKAQVIEKIHPEAYDTIKEGESEIETAWIKLKVLGSIKTDMNNAFDTLENLKVPVTDGDGDIEVSINEDKEMYHKIVDSIATIDNFLAEQEDDTKPLVNRILGDDINIKELRVILEDQEKEAEMISLLNMLGVTREQYENESIDF